MKKGFSLTELLVVIVIIAVLASLLFPVMQSAKSRAKETTCVSNLHQIYIAMQLYREDNSEYPPSPGLPFILDNPYLGGTTLKCTSKKDKWVIGDYVLNGPRTNWPFPDEMPMELKKWTDCRDKRGSDFPIAWDNNHKSQLQGYETGDAIYILVRESGQIHRIPAQKKVDLLNLDAKLPCLLEQGVANL